MLFLDDFLEMLEELPAEFKERFSEMRKIDSDIEAGLDQTKKSIDEFFELGVQLPDEEKQKRFQYFQQQYARYRSMAAEKVSMAERMQEILSTYLQHLDKEKTHFKYELEADNPGVTEAIEKRFSDYVEAVVAARKERKRRHPSENGSQGGETAFKFSKNLFDSFSSLSNIPDFSGITDDDLLSPFAPMLAMPMTPTNGSTSGRGRKPNPPDSHASKKRPSIPSLKGTLSVPSVMNGMALSPAVSEKSWSSALNDNHSPNSSMISNPLVSSSAMPNFAGTESRHGRQRKLTSRVQEMFTEAVQRQRRTHPPIHHHEEGETERSEDEDPDDAHKSWCICGEASYGDMICCDNETCTIQWFHYECLGMSSGTAPKGKWFCMKCQGLPFPPLPNHHQHSFDASF